MSDQAIDFEQLTLNEVETIENLTGISIDQVVGDGTPKGKNLKAILFVLKKRDNPNFTIEEAGNFTLSEVTAMFGANDPKGNN